jgi:glycosyltransferase involved in cell wall biosynthesis
LNFKRTRKHLYIAIARSLGIYTGIVWHASTNLEAQDIRHCFPRVRDIDDANMIPGGAYKQWKVSDSLLATALDLSSMARAADPKRNIKKPGELRIVFVSRISRKKNLAGALTTLEGISGDITFDIYGPAEDRAYWEECQRLISHLPPNIRVNYLGQIEHNQISQVFAEHDLFFFPTLAENYGHVISEALSSGCPVLISDQTPWRNLEQEGAGWDIPLNEVGRFRAAIQQCVHADAEWFLRFSQRAKEYGEQCNSDPQVIEANRRLFYTALA